MLNTRIEAVSQSSLRPSSALWLREGEQLVAKWDTYTIEFTYGDATCDFANLTQGNDDCEICNVCEDDNATLRQLCPHVTWAQQDFNKPRVVVHDGFIISPQPVTVLLANSYGGCSAYSYEPEPFTPTSNATFQVLTPEVSSYQATLAEKKVFVINDEMPQQKTAYQLMPHTDTDTSFVWFKWIVADVTDINGNTVWEDNFTPNVRIGKVVIKKGKKVIDPITGRFKLDEMTATVVRPSHIRFFPSFQDGSQSASDPAGSPCWANTASDGDLDLSNCRPASNNNNGFLQIATPTYSSASSTDTLTWFVAFDPSAVPSLAADEVLAIEFTIQGV
jgi:hypothetical protein